MKTTTHPPGPFTPAQLDKLRRDYGKFETISVENGEKLGKMLDKCPADQLRHLADADIRFVSVLARNRLLRLGLEVS